MTLTGPLGRKQFKGIHMDRVMIQLRFLCVNTVTLNHYEEVLTGSLQEEQFRIYRPNQHN
jgi:hypothetical protein